MLNVIQSLVFILAWGLPVLAFAEEPLRLWHAYRGAEQAALQQIVSTFPGTVDVLAVPYEAYGAKLAASIPLGEGPHVYIDAHERLGDFRERNIVAKWPALLPKDTFIPNAEAAVRDGGQVWGIPLSLKSLALYVNTDLIIVNPTSLEQIESLRSTLPKNVFPLAYEARSAYAHAAILSAHGGRILNPETSRYEFVGSAAERSLVRVQDLLARGVVVSEADGALVTDLFRSGAAATAISGPWLASDLVAAGNPVPYRILALPRIDSEGASMRPLLTVEIVMLSPDGAARNDALELARHLADRPAAEIRAAIARSVSARRDIDHSHDPDLEALATQAHNAVIMPATSAMRAAWEPANQAIRKFLRGDTDARSALEEGLGRFEDVRRPPPAARSPTPLLVALGVFAFVGALQMVQRARSSEFRAAVRRSVPAYGYVAVGAITVGLVVLLPIFVGVGVSLFAGHLHDMHYVGLANYVEILSARGNDLLSTGSFYVVLAVTVLWTVVNLIFHLGIGLTLGLVLSRPAMRLRGMYRVLLILPWAVPNYVTALAWRGMFHRQFGAVTGLINQINGLLGLSLEPIAWFSRFTTAFSANVATNVWLGFPFMMVVTIGALTTVPRDVIEAARVDGATRWQRITRITLPMIAPAMMPAVALGAIWTFNMFNVVFLVSGGDPDGSTDILISEAYRWAFTREAQYGYACAYAVLIFLLLLGMTRFSLGRSRSWGGLE